MEQSSSFMSPTPYEASSHDDQIAYMPKHALTHYMPTLHISMLDSMHVSTQSNAMLMNLHAYTLIQCISSTIKHTINHGEMSQMPQECFFHAHHAFHEASHALKMPHHNPEPNLFNDDVLTIILYLNYHFSLYNNNPMTMASTSPKGGKSYGSNVAQYDGDPEVNAKVAHPRVKMKKLSFLYTIPIPFDPDDVM